MKMLGPINNATKKMDSVCRAIIASLLDCGKNNPVIGK
jgi:hypothetical protein